MRPHSFYTNRNKHRSRGHLNPFTKGGSSASNFKPHSCISACMHATNTIYISARPISAQYDTRLTRMTSINISAVDRAGDITSGGTSTIYDIDANTRSFYQILCPTHTKLDLIVSLSFVFVQTFAIHIDQPTDVRNKLRVPADNVVAALCAITAPESADVPNSAFTYIGTDQGPKCSVVVPAKLVSSVEKLIKKDGIRMKFQAQAKTHQGNHPAVATIFISEVGPGKGIPAKKVAKPWLSVALDHESCAEEHVIRHLNHSLTALGFKGVQSTQSKTPQNVKLNLVHCKFDTFDTCGVASEFDWHSLSEAAAKNKNGGIQYHIGTRLFRAHVRKFSFMTAFKLKPVCFHPLSMKCLCANAGRSAPPLAKTDIATAVRSAREAANALNTTTTEGASYTHMAGDMYTSRDSWDNTLIIPSNCSYSSVPHYYTRTRVRLRLSFNKVWTFKYTSEWNSSLGYPGEGPTNIKFMSLNINGALSIDSWREAIKVAQIKHATIICLQEINLSKGDEREARLAEIAERAGFTAYFSYIPRHRTRGGCATLIATSLGARVSRLKRLKGGGSLLCDLHFSEPDLTLRVANVYATQVSAERVTQLRTLRKHITRSTVLLGDFNCVLDMSLDLKRDATSPYDNAGSEELQSIIDENGLIDEIRLQNGNQFEFTHLQSTEAGACASRIDLHLLPDIPNGQWTSSIANDVAISDHSAVISTFEIVGSTKGHDLFTLNAALILNPYIHSKLGSLVAEAVDDWKQGKPATKTLNRLKYQVRNFLKKETKAHARATNAKLAQIDARLEALHLNQRNKPTHQGAAARSALQKEKEKLIFSLKAPKPHSSRLVHSKEEMMSVVKLYVA